MSDKDLLNKWKGCLLAYSRHIKSGEDITAVVEEAIEVYVEIRERGLNISPSQYQPESRKLYIAISNAFIKHEKEDVSDMEFFVPRPILHQAGKSALAIPLIKLFPKHKVYVEPFSGSAAVYWRKKPSEQEIISDFSDLWPFVFNTIKNLTDDEIKKLESKQWKIDKKHFELIKGLKKDGQYNELPKLEKLYLLMYLSKASFFRNWTSFDYTAEGRTIKTSFKEWRERLANTEVVQSDYREIVKKYDSPDTLFFFDPPYYQKGDNGEKTDKRDVLDCGDGIDMEEFAEICNGLKGKCIITLPRDAKILQVFKKRGMLLSKIRRVQRFAHKRGDTKTEKNTLHWPVIRNFEHVGGENYFEDEWYEFVEYEFENEVMPFTFFKQPNASHGCGELEAYNMSGLLNHVPSLPVTVEQYFNGMRVQIHKDGERIGIFKRAGDDVTERFTKSLSAIASLPIEKAVFDCVVTGFLEDAEGEVQFNITDILYYAGEVSGSYFEGAIHDKPFSERRMVLEHIFERVTIMGVKLSECITVDEMSKLPNAVDFFARKPNSMGAILKSCSSEYRFEERADNWVMYRNEADLCVEVQSIHSDDNGRRYDCVVRTPSGYTVKIGHVTSDMDFKQGDILRVAFNSLSKVINEDTGEYYYKWKLPRIIEQKEMRSIPDTTYSVDNIIEMLKGDIIPEEDESFKPLTHKERSELPDSAFCYVKVINGKKVRKFPAHDEARVRNGLARLPQANLTRDEKQKVFRCLKAKAKKMGISVSEQEFELPDEWEESLNKLIDHFQVYPNAEKIMRFAWHVHVRGQNVHIDDRRQIDSEHVIGFTHVLPVRLSKRPHTFEEAEMLVKKEIFPYIENSLKDPEKSFLSIEKEGLSFRKWLDFEGVFDKSMKPDEDPYGYYVKFDEGWWEPGVLLKDKHELFFHAKYGRIPDTKFVERIRGSTKKTIEGSAKWEFASSYNNPFVLSEEAVRNKWIPPFMQSALPSKAEEATPGQFRYWTLENEEKRRYVRSVLIDALEKGDPVVEKLQKCISFKKKSVFTAFKQTIGEKNAYHLVINAFDKNLHLFLPKNILEDETEALIAGSGADTIKEGVIEAGTDWNPTTSKSKASKLDEGLCDIQPEGSGFRLRLYGSYLSGDFNLTPVSDTRLLISRRFGSFSETLYLDKDYMNIVPKNEDGTKWLEITSRLFVPGRHKGNGYTREELEKMVLAPKKGNRIVYINFYHGQDEPYRTGILKELWWDAKEEWVCEKDNKKYTGANMVKGVITDPAAISAIENGDISHVSAEIKFDRQFDKDGNPFCVNLICNGMAITDDPAVKEACIKEICTDEKCRAVIPQKV